MYIIKFFPNISLQLVEVFGPYNAVGHRKLLKCQDIMSKFAICAKL